MRQQPLMIIAIYVLTLESHAFAATFVRFRYEFSIHFDKTFTMIKLIRAQTGTFDVKRKIFRMQFNESMCNSNENLIQSVEYLEF